MGHSKNYCFPEAGDKLRVPVNILATLLSPQSTLHSLNISRKSLFGCHFTVSDIVYVFFLFFNTIAN